MELGGKIGDDYVLVEVEPVIHLFMPTVSDQFVLLKFV